MRNLVGRTSLHTLWCCWAVAPSRPVVDNLQLILLPLSVRNSNHRFEIHPHVVFNFELHSRLVLDRSYPCQWSRRMRLASRATSCGPRAYEAFTGGSFPTFARSPRRCQSLIMSMSGYEYIWDSRWLEEGILDIILPETFYGGDNKRTFKMRQSWKLVIWLRISLGLK